MPISSKEMRYTLILLAKFTTFLQSLFTCVSSDTKQNVFNHYLKIITQLLLLAGISFLSQRHFPQLKKLSAKNQIK